MTDNKMITREIEGRRLSPGAAWEIYVGGQSPKQFAEYAADARETVEQAVDTYVTTGEYCSDLSGDDRAALSELMLALIEHDASESTQEAT